MKDKQFTAILAKNQIAKELREFKRGQEISIKVILSCLEDIEDFIGMANQPSAEDTFNSKYN